MSFSSQASRIALFFAALTVLFSSMCGATDWPQFGFDSRHSGNNTSESAITIANVHTLVQVYAVPLPTVSLAAPVFLERVNTAAGLKDVLFIETLDGRILAIDASNGGLLWSKQPTVVSGRFGPTSESVTPAIDPGRQFVYAYGLDGRIHKYAVTDGAEDEHAPWPIVSSLKPDVEHGSSAITIGTAANGPSYLYMVMNGYNGDGGDYQGHLTTVNLANGTSTVFNANCSELPIHFVENGTFGIDDCATTKSGIWGRPGAVFDSDTARVFIATANGSYDANVGGHNWGDSLLALPVDGGADSSGTPLDSYTPTEFMILDFSDSDFGSGALAILPTPLTSKYAHLGVMMGKDNLIRLLNLDDLSGNHGPRFVGGELQIIGNSMAYDLATPQASVWVNTRRDGSTWIFEAPYGRLIGLQLIADDLGNPSLIQRWVSHSAGTSSSSAVANGVLFANGLNSLQAFDPETGSILWSAPNNSFCCGWGSPIVINGRVFANGNGILTMYALDQIFANDFD